MFSKSRSSTSSYPAQMNAADRTVTIALPTSTHPAPSPTRAEEIALFQYQQELLADFFSGGAAPRPRPPPPASSSGHSHSSHAHSHSASSKSKTKWGAALADRDAKAKAAAAAAAYPEPTTLSKRMFQFGFVCPLLWLAGVVLLCRPPRPRIEHEGVSVSSAEERARRLKVYKRAEERWGSRCLTAWLVFMAVVIMAVLVGVFVVRNELRARA